MANIVEEFLTKREYAYTKTARMEEMYNIRYENYELSGDETLDGLKLVISVETAYMSNGVPVAQDFVISSNRGCVRRASVNEIFSILRMFL